MTEPKIAAVKRYGFSEWYHGPVPEEMPDGHLVQYDDYAAAEAKAAQLAQCTEEMAKATENFLEMYCCDDGSSVNYDGTTTECKDCIPARAALSRYQLLKEQK